MANTVGRVRVPCLSSYPSGWRRCVCTSTAQVTGRTLQTKLCEGLWHNCKTDMERWEEEEEEEQAAKEEEEEEQEAKAAEEEEEKEEKVM